MIPHTYSQANQQAALSRLTQKLLFYIPLGLAAVGFLCCLGVEIFRIEISQEGRNWFYGAFGTASFCLCILLNTAYGRNYGLGWLRSLIFSFLSFQVIFNYLSVAWANLDAAIFGVGSVASYRSAMFLPLLCLILSRFCKTDVLNLCDYLTPYFFFHHGFVTLACWIAGCCAGKTCSWGLLNPLTGATCFPTQPCIILLSVAVTFWGLHYSKKYAYKANGMVFANSLCIYGFFRYLIELVTDDRRVFWVLSWLSVCSLAMIVEGFLVRHIIRKRKKHPDLL